MRMLGTVLALGHDISAEQFDRVDAAEACLAGWFYSLTEAKREILDESGKVDEMLFQGHMIVHT